MANRLKQSVESLIITVMGVILLFFSLNIKSNPIKYGGWTDIAGQAKLMPIIMSAGIILLGLVLFLKQMNGKDKSKQLSKAEWIKIGITLLIIACYLICVYNFKFIIPTIIYSFVIMFFLNWGQRKPVIIALFALLAIVLGLLVLPRLISLRLP